METLALEVERLNAETIDSSWPDVVAVADTGTIQYAIQFPGEGLSGDFLPPAEGALQNHVPPIYVVLVLRPCGDRTLNRCLRSLSDTCGSSHPVPNCSAGTGCWMACRKRRWSLRGTSTATLRRSCQCRQRCTTSATLRRHHCGSRPRTARYWRPSNTIPWQGSSSRCRNEWGRSGVPIWNCRTCCRSPQRGSTSYSVDSNGSRT